MTFVTWLITFVICLDSADAITFELVPEEEDDNPIIQLEEEESCIDKRAFR